MNAAADAGIEPVRIARIAGLFYLLVIAGGIFAALIVRDPMIVHGDAAATARSIAAGEALWRLGIAVHALYLLPGAAFAVILYRLFRHVQPTVALLALVFAIAPVAIEALLLTGLAVPLVMIDEGATLGALAAEQREALTYLGVRLFLIGWGFSLLLFSGFCVLIGVLILRSRLIPRFIGALLILAGAGYFVNSLTGIVAPSLESVLLPWILLLPFVGELSLAIWLLTRGIDVAEPVTP